MPIIPNPADILKDAKATKGIAKPSSDIGSERVYDTYTSTCTMVYFHYTKQNFGVPGQNRKPFSTSEFMATFAPGKQATITDKSKPSPASGVVLGGEIISCTIEKSLSRPAGSFELVLAPTRNWRELIFPGDWVLLYMGRETDIDTKSLKGCQLIGNVDRVARSKQKNEETDDTEIRYKISGRNFGKVFEETPIFFNPYDEQPEVIDVTLREAGLPLTGSPDQLVKSLIDIFLGKGAKLPNLVTQALSYWYIPEALASRFKERKKVKDYACFFDILGDNITKGLPGFKGRGMMSQQNGSDLWAAIQNNANSLINEVFVDEAHTADGTVVPKFTLRPKPFTSIYYRADASTKGYPEMKHLHLTDIERIDITDAQILYDDLGKDDYSRLNYIFLRTAQDDYDFSQAESYMKGKNPLVIPESIKRHGLKKLDDTIEYIFSREGFDPNTEVLTFKGFVYQVYDFYYANHLYESGTIQCVGIKNAELGKSLSIVNRKVLYYIEGYRHDWSYPNMWTTEFIVTRGQYEKDYKRVFIGASDKDFGDKDENPNMAYVAQQTIVPKDSD